MKHTALVLIILLFATSAGAQTTAPAKPITAPATIAKPANTGTVQIYRCIDDKGRNTLRDTPCPIGQKQTEREMIRPKDAPPKPASKSKEPPPPERIIVVQPPRDNPFSEPPPLWQCTDFEGKTRDSETNDSNPRCVPLWALGFDMRRVPIQYRDACRWVQDSCVRYPRNQVCDRWEIKRIEAERAERTASWSELQYKRSELNRILQIQRDSCQ
jgi:hypothetical protein